MLNRAQVLWKPSKYRLLGLVGQGQFGQVFCAIHRKTGQLVALKNLDQQRFPTHQFLRELRFLLSLQHEHIVTCYAIEHTQTGRYLVMDYCEGGTLRSLMTDESHLKLNHSLCLVADILSGLEHAHSRGIVHCDIKPENILLRLKPKGWVAKISDFGVARLSQELSKQGGGNTGSPAYMAPERFYGQYSPTSDLYSVGIILFELIAGYRPFSGAPGALMDAHLNRPVSFPESIPEPLRPVIQTSLQKLSARRFHSAREMLVALQAASAELGIETEELHCSVNVPLIESRHVPIACPFQAHQRDRLQHRISHMGRSLLVQAQADTLPQPESSPSFLYTAGEHALAFYSQPVLPNSVVPTVSDATSAGDADKTSTPHSALLPHRQRDGWRSLHLQDPIQALEVRPQGCFLLNTTAVHYIPTSELWEETPLPKLVHQFEQDCIAAIDDRGQWLATVADMRPVQPKSGFSTISFHPLPDASHAMVLAKAPTRLLMAGQATSLLQAIALDSRHVAVFSDMPPDDGNGRAGKPRINSASKHPCEAGTYIEIMTRRGKRLGAIALPMLLGRVIRTTTPYRLLATDQYDLYSILQIDFKPFRITRFPVQVIPTFLASAQWGHLVMNQRGHMVLLDQQGCQVNRIEGPPNPTAVALYEPQGLMVASWEYEQAHLHTVDLKMLGVDLVF